MCQIATNSRYDLPRFSLSAGFIWMGCCIWINRQQ